MPSRRSARHRQRGVVRLGLLALALSLVHAPLPQPDFHNLRHHDAPGEVCAYHDHLLRWHPGARSADNVALLHWHWFIPTATGDAPSSDEDGAALHAHVPDWQAAYWDEGPRLAPDDSARFLGRPVPSPLGLTTVLDRADARTARSATGPPFPLAFGATFAPRASLTTLLGRRVC